MEGYGIFLMSQLAIEKGVIDKELEHDLIWGEAQVLYKAFQASDFDDENISEYEAIVNFLNATPTKEKLINQQIELQENSDINIVTCGNCGTVLLHKKDEESNEIQCWACYRVMDKTDCPDFYYTGMSYL